MTTSRRRGISMIETTIAVIIAGTLLAASIVASGATATTGKLADDRGLASILIDELASEIASKPYDDEPPPEEPAVPLTASAVVASGEAKATSFASVESPEARGVASPTSVSSGRTLAPTSASLTGTVTEAVPIMIEPTDSGRTTYNVLDYHDLSESPPAGPTGNPVLGAEDLTRTVEITFLSPTDPKTQSASDQGLALVTIRIFRGPALLVEGTLVRAKALDKVSIQ